MKEFLSIGEVARLKKITVKALRYYEKIGIFLPAYINKEIGCRYYKMEQMVMLDLILTCLELGIPLKQFPSYLDENCVLDLEHMVHDGTAMAQQEIVRINRTLKKLENMSNHLEESEHLPRASACYLKHFPERFLLLKELTEPYPSQQCYVSDMTELYTCLETRGYISLYQQGIMYHPQGQLQAFAYMEISKPDEWHDVCLLPAGTCHCRCFDSISDPDWLAALKPVIQKNSDSRCILLQERYSRRLSKEPFWETQIIQK